MKAASIEAISSPRSPVGSSIGYSVSKAALTHYTRCLAQGVAPEITVNMVSPGSMLTRWVPDRTEEQIQATIEGSPLRSFSELDDVASAILMVAKNDCMTGQVVVVDAGFSLVH